MHYQAFPWEQVHKAVTSGLRYENTDYAFISGCNFFLTLNTVKASS